MSTLENDEDFKSITDWQRALVIKIMELNPETNCSKEVKSQLDGAMTKVVDEHGCFEIMVVAGEEVPYDNLMIEARYPDFDTSLKAEEYFGEKLFQELKDMPGYGPHVSVMLFASKGYLWKVEFNKEDDSDIINLNPDPNLLISTKYPLE